jgi:uncharacterized protein
MLTEAEIDRIVRLIVARIQPQKAIIFGSYAKGTATIDSDLDILVVKETDLPMARRADDLVPMLSAVLVPVDVHVFTPEEVQEYGKDEFSFVGCVVRYGRTVFQQ